MNARSEVRVRVRGLYGIADSSGDPERLAAQLLEGGCRLVQLRCKDWQHDDIHRLASELSRRSRAVGATFIVNDHPEIAAAVGADGVHLGQTDADTAEVRKIVGPDSIIGRSTNAPGEIENTLKGADYLAFGPMFPTGNISRPKAVQGVEVFRSVRRQVAIPLVAIGGIDAGALPLVRGAGADAWAVIGAIANAEDPVTATRMLCG